MSRIGKQLIEVPEKTTVSVDGGQVTVSGPQGEITRTITGPVEVSVSDEGVTVTPTARTQFARSLWGTWASHIKNMVTGVNEPYTKKLIVEGVGYQADVSGDTLTLKLGFSHDIHLPIPDDISVSVEKNVITISGVNKESVGGFAGMIRSKKKPEPYKGKGIRYEDEIIRRKQGKKAV